MRSLGCIAAAMGNEPVDGRWVIHGVDPEAVEEFDRVDPSQTIEIEIDGTWFEFKRVTDAAEAEVQRVLLGVPVAYGTDGSAWVAERILSHGKPATFVDGRGERSIGVLREPSQ